MLKKVIFLLLVLVAVGLLSRFQSNANASTEYVIQTSNSEQLLELAFKNKQSDLQVNGEGVVVKLLTDDLQGSRHQRFILKLASGQSLLIAHNIDLAPRIDGLRTGDTVAFFGEYEWNKKGGLIHWTHHDPKGQHPGGWLKHQGQTYQ